MREFVAEFQFYDAEVRRQAGKLLTDAASELSGALASKEAAKGSQLSEAEIRSVTQEITKRFLGRELPSLGPAAKDAANTKAIENMSRDKVLADGTRTTEGAYLTDVAWQTNLAAQNGRDAAGAKNIGARTDAELAGHIRSIASTLSFGNTADGAYHAHKHSKELPIPTTDATEMTTYLQEARRLIRDTPGVVRQNQNGSRSVVFEVNGMRAIVTISIDGNASIATFGKSN